MDSRLGGNDRCDLFMITLLHGDNIEASRTELNHLKLQAKGKEIRELEGKGIDSTFLTQALESSSLFGGDILVVIEHLFVGLGKKITLVKDLAQKMSVAPVDVILWEDKEIGKTAIDNLGKGATVRLFKTPVIIFKFLDSIRPNNASFTIPLLKQLMETEPPELVFSMMIRRNRQLIQLSDHVTPEGLQGWQTKGLTNQARLFTMDRLLVMHTSLLDIEYSLKIGSSPFTLSQLIEQFLVDL